MKSLADVETMTTAATATPSTGTVPRKPHRRWLRWLGILVTLLIALVVFHAALLRGLAHLLVKDQPVEPADAVVLMAASGPYQTLPFDELAAFHRNGLARRIVLIEDRSSRIARAGIVPTVETVLRRELRTRGVPEDALVTLPYEDDYPNGIHRLRDWLQDNPDWRVTLLCGELRSRTTTWVARTVLGPEEIGRVRFRALPDARFTTTNWWHSRQGIVQLCGEYIVLLHTMAFDAPAEEERWDPDEYEQDLRRRISP